MSIGGWIGNAWESTRKGFTSIAENGIYLSLLPAIYNIGNSIVGRDSKTVGEQFSAYFKGFQGLGTGFGQVLSPLITPADPGDKEYVPGLSQLQWGISKLLWLYDRGITYGVRRPVTSLMLAGDAADQGQDFFAGDTWRRAWNESEYVTPGQAVAFNAAQMFGIVSPADRIKYDPRTPEGRQKYYDDPLFQGMSGSLDFALAFVDPFRGVSRATKAGISQIPGQTIVTPSARARAAGGLEKEAFGKTAQLKDTFADAGDMSRNYQRVYDAAQSESLVGFQRRYFNEGAFGGVTATAIWSLAKAGDRANFADAMLASRGSYEAWSRLQINAAEVAANIGRTRQALNISTAVSGYGKSRAATDSVDGALDTQFQGWVQDFAQQLKDVGAPDAPENFWTYFQGSTAAQATIRATILDKLRVGLHQKSTSYSPTLMGSWMKSAARLVNPSARYASLVDVNAVSSFKSFRYNIERSILTEAERGYLNSKYMSAGTAQERSAIVTEADERILDATLSKYGLKPSDFDQYREELTSLRAIVKDVLDKSPRHIPSSILSEANKLLKAGRTIDGKKLEAVAIEYQKMVDRGEAPEVMRLLPDERAQTNLIPEANGIDPERPFFQSTTANLMPMLDYRALEAGISRYLAPMRRMEQRTAGLEVAGSRLADVVNLNAYRVQQRVGAFLQGMQTVWSAVAILRPAQPVRSGADDMMRAITEQGMIDYFLTGYTGSTNLWARARKGQTLAQRWASAKVNLLRQRADKPDIDIDDVGSLDELELVNERPGFYQVYPAGDARASIFKDDDGNLIGANFDSMEAALIKGVLPLEVYTDLAVDMARNGRATMDLAAISERFENGLISENRMKREIAEYALDRAGVSAFTNPNWQRQLFSDIQGSPAGIIVDPLTSGQVPLGTPNYSELFDQAVSGDYALEHVASYRGIGKEQFPLRGNPLKRQLEHEARSRAEGYEGRFMRPEGPEYKAIERAFTEYQGGRNVVINALLRPGKGADLPDFPKREKLIKEAPQHIRSIDKVMRLSKTKAPITVYRGTTFPQEMLVNPARWDTEDIVGLEFYDPAYTSTSSSRSNATMFTEPKMVQGKLYPEDPKKTLFRILVPEGTHAVSLGLREHEVLFARGTRMRVVADNGTDADGVRHVDLVVSTPGAAKTLGGEPAKDVFRNYEAGPATVVKVDPTDGYLEIDDVYDFLMDHREDITDKRYLVHGVREANGDIRLTLVRPRGAPPRVAERMTREQRQDFKMKLSQVGRSDLVMRTKDGKDIVLRGVFAGMEGDWTRTTVGSRTQLNNVWANTVSVKNTSRHIIKNSRLQNFKPGQRGYEAGWEYYANAVVANDPVARMVLEGRNYGDVMNWLRTPEGRAWDKARQQPLPVSEHVLAVMNATERLVPPVGNLREKVLRHEATAADLDAAFPGWRDDAAVRETMPDVLGQSDAMVFGGAPLMDWLKTKTDNLFRVMMDMPIDKLVRFPFAHVEYRNTAMPMLRSYVKWADDNGKPILEGEIRRIENLARQHTVDKVKDVLYDTSSRTDVASALQLMMPFASAIADSIFKWMRLAYRKPVETFGNWYRFWYFPDRAGLVYDQDGNHLSSDDEGREVWTNPLTGERQPLRDSRGEEIRRDKYVLMRVPQMAGRQSLEREGGRFFQAFNKDSMNPILSVPTAGPIVALPMNSFVLSRPEYADNAFIKRFVLPFGPTDRGALEQLTPGLVRQWRIWRNDRENEDMATSTAMEIYQTWMAEWASGKRAKQPTLQEAKDEAAGEMGLRFLVSAVSPVSLQYYSPYKPYTDYYRQLVRKHMGDEREAMKEFRETAGDEFRFMTAHVTKANIMMPATSSAYKQYKQYKDLVEANPDIAGLITGGEGAGSFQKAIYEWQKTITVGGVPLRRYLTISESVDDLDKRASWDEYSKLMNVITTKLRQRGLTSIRSRAALDLASMKDQWINDHKLSPDGTQLSAWYKDYSETDSSVMEGRIRQMRNILAVPGLVETRPDLQGLQEYLVVRDRYIGLMKRYRFKTLTGEKARGLARSWDAYVNNLTLSNQPFLELHNRWLTRDELEVVRGE